MRISLLFLVFLTCVLKGQSSTSVLSYGALADGIMRTDGAMQAGSSTLISPSASFSSSDKGKYIQVIGAGPGGTSHGDAAMSAGSANLNSSSGTFASSDIGRGIVVVGAGAGGSNLVTSITGYSSPNSIVLKASAQSSVSGQAYYYGYMTLEATIQAVTNSSTVVLSAAAQGSISSAVYAYGTDNHASFQSAVDAAGQAGGGTISVPAAANCPSGAVCGYVVRASDQQTAQAPAAVKIRYSNVSLAGDASQPALFCRGAYGSYTNTVAYPRSTGYIRGFCLTIGDNGGPNGSAGESVSNVTVSNLHLYGMTNGNTFNNNFGYPPQASDGWDVTHKAIYMWNNSPFTNITIDSLIIQDFKGENIFSGGSALTGMVIKNSTLTNFNSDGISMLAADLQVLNNTISNGSNAAVENSTESSGGAALVRQVYQGNTIAQFPREGIVVVGVDGGVASGNVQILNNTFDTIAQVNRSGTSSAMYIANQNNMVAPANVTVSGNTCHDCYSFGVFATSGNTLIQGNTFTVDQYNVANFLSFMNPMLGTTISGNTGSATAHAQASGVNIGSVYQINPGYQNGAFAWKNVVIKGNNWTFNAPQYQFVTSSGASWGLVSQDNLNWQGDTCNGCTHSDQDHGLIDLSRTSVIQPYGPQVYVTGNSSPVTATIDGSKEENGAQLQIVNAGSNTVSFNSDVNLSLSAIVNLAAKASVNFVYSTALGKFTLQAATAVPLGPPANVTVSGGTPQVAGLNAAFSSSLQALVTDSNGNPLSAVPVIFTAPLLGASGTFSGLAVATALTGANGIASSPTFTANSQAGTYAVVASVAGLSNTVSFSLINATAQTSNGSLTGAATSSAAAVNLTQEGNMDWEHWGESSLNRKTGVTPQLTAPTMIGSGTVLTYANDPRPMSWTDGTPTVASSNNLDGIYIVGVGQGFSITAPADTMLRKLVVHVGGWYAGGTLRAHLSDSSAADYTDVTAEISGQFDRNYTFSYHAASIGQKLTVSWTMTTGEAYGNVTINGAALAVSTAALTSTGGTGQSASINAGFLNPLQVTAINGSGPVSGLTVNFTAPSSGAGAKFGSSVTATAVTNSSGIATSPSLTANSTLGSYSVVASATGYQAANFSLNNVAGLPSSIKAAAGTPQNALVGSSFSVPLQASVTDSNGNALPGVSVTFSAPSPGASASLGGAATIMVTTNSSGLAVSPTPVANGVTGSYVVNASVAGLAGDALFLLANVADPPASIGSQAGLSQSAVENTAFPTALQALVIDATGHPLSGTTVIFAAPTSGASGTFGGSTSATVMTNASGVATAPTFTANGSAGSYTVTAMATGVSSAASFNLTNTLPTASPNGAAASLIGTGTSSTNSANLTAEGPTDWVHWGDSALNRKAGVTPQISNFSYINSGTAIPYNNDLRPLSWSDGTPLASSTNNLDGLYTSSVNGGFGFSVPASTTPHTLTVHVGGWLSAGQFIAHLSDGSAPDYMDVTSFVNGQYDRTYTIVYSAKSAGQSLEITWIDTANGGNVTLNGAALQ